MATEEGSGRGNRKRRWKKWADEVVRIGNERRQR